MTKLVTLIVGMIVAILGLDTLYTGFVFISLAYILLGIFGFSVGLLLVRIAIFLEKNPFRGS